LLPGFNIFRYDDQNRPTSITYPTGTDTFVYNALGQRMRASLDGTAYRYVYNGNRVLEETNDSGTVLARHTTETGSYYDPWVHMWRTGDVSRFPLMDGVGTTRRLVDSSNNHTDIYELTAFGLDRGSTITTTNPYQFGGAWGYITDPSGMLQLGARFYWPEIGRFIQQDPIGHGPNAYGYVENRPTVGLDPEGTRITTVPRLGAELQDYYGGEDKLAHCVWTCMTVSAHPFGRRVGTAVASAAGWLKERIADWGEYDENDMIDNGIGIHHGNELSASQRRNPQEACEKRCRDSLWDTGAEIGIGDPAESCRR